MAGRGPPEIYRGAEYAVSSLPKSDEVAVASDQVDKTIEASRRQPKPDKSATARSSSSTSTMRFASARERPMRAL